jgi:hypothetical protein
MIGLEYRVYNSDNSFITIANSKDTYDRLINSDFYKFRKDIWNDNNNNNFVKFLDGNIDILLNELELYNLYRILQIEYDDIDMYGWFIVNYS